MPFGAFVQVGDGIEGLVHISEMSAHHVDLPEQVVTPGEELWVKIIDLDLQRRRISLSIKQAAEGGVVAEEYREHFGEHAYDEQGNYIGPEVAAGFEPETEAQKAWAEEYAAQYGTDPRPTRPRRARWRRKARGRGRAGPRSRPTPPPRRRPRPMPRSTLRPSPRPSLRPRVAHPSSRSSPCVLFSTH